MKYTKEQLQAMSGFEVNKVLARMIYGYPENKDIAKRIHSGAIDFCNTPNDIMPLAFEHKISLISLSDGYMASKCKTIYMEEAYRNIKFCDPSDMEFAHENPLRAIACCLILVLQGEKE